MNIRFVEVSDAKRLIEIYAYYVTDTTVSFETEVPTVENFENRIKQTTASYPYIVMEDEGKIIGYAYASRYRSRKAFDWSVELSVYVDRPNQKQGIGAILYKKLLEMLKQQGIATAYACLAYPNPGSEAFHKKLGFDFVGIFHQSGYKFESWQDTCWFELKLNEEVKNILPIEKIHEMYQG